MNLSVGYCSASVKDVDNNDSVFPHHDWLEDVPIEPSRDPTVLRDQVLEQLKQVIDPKLHQDIVSLGFIKKLQIDYDAQQVALCLQLTSSSYSVRNYFVNSVTKVLQELGWVSDISIKFEFQSPQTAKRAMLQISPNLRSVTHIVLVASCKGGVGKSTIACNLAYMLSSLGAKVGLVDTDIYGPSLPYLIPIAEQRIYFTQADRHIARQRQSVTYEKSTFCGEKYHVSEQECCSTRDVGNGAETSEAHLLDSEATAKQNMERALSTGSGGLVPLVYMNVKLMSYGYLKSLDHAPLRGPVASTIVYQMITHTFWGELDYLIVDTPPGTGDIHLTLCESFPISGVLMITTPQQLSMADCEKGLSFFNSFNVPVLALVENMSYFVCDQCDTHHCIFKENQEDFLALVRNHRIPIHTKLPLHTSFSTLQFKGQDLTECHLPVDQSAQSCVSVAKPNARPIVVQNSTMSQIPADHSKDARCAVDNATTPQFPFALVFDENNAVWSELRVLAQNLFREIALATFCDDRLPILTAEPKGMLKLTLFHKPHLEPRPEESGFSLNCSTSPVSPEGTETTILVINAREVRVHCQCAECSDQITGRSLLSLRKVNPDICAKSIDYVGNFMVKIQWSDGHASQMSLAFLEKTFRTLHDNRHPTMTQKDTLVQTPCSNFHLDW